MSFFFFFNTSISQGLFILYAQDIAVSKTVKNPCAPEVYTLVKRDRDQKQTKTMHILAGLVEKRQQG